MLLDANGAYFFRPHPYRMSAAGRVSVEQPTYRAPRPLDEYIPPAETANVKQFVDACVPAFATATHKRSHAIMYDTLTDGLPALGRIPNIDGLFIAAGFGTSAFSVAPAVGETLAQLLVDGNPARDITPFAPTR